MSFTDKLTAFLRQARRVLIIGSCFAVLVWLLFLDSHSVFSRIQLHREQSELQVDNNDLEKEIADLEAKLSRELTPEEIETLSRETYGMSREGETIYLLDENDDE